eukprot:UN34053
MDMKNLSELEALCKVMFSSPDKKARTQARERLKGFENSPTYIKHCQFILTKSKEPIAHMMASTSLLKLVSDFWNNFNEDEILKLRDFCLEYIAKHNSNPNVKRFIFAKLIQVPCRLTKLGWASGSQRFRNINDKILVFFGKIRHIFR